MLNDAFRNEHYSKMTSVLIKNKIKSETVRSTHRRKTMWSFRDNTAIYKSGREASEKNQPCEHLEKLRENKFILFNPPSLWYYAMSDLVN